MRMIVLKYSHSKERYAVNVDNIVSIDLQRVGLNDKIGVIKICTVDKNEFKIMKKVDVIDDLFDVIVNYCRGGLLTGTVIPDNGDDTIFTVESD